MVSAIRSLTTDIPYYKNSFSGSPVAYMGRSKTATSNSLAHNRSPNIQRAFCILTSILLFTSKTFAQSPSIEKCFANGNKTAGMRITYPLSEPLSPLAKQDTLCNFSEVNCLDIKPCFDNSYTCNYSDLSALTFETFGITKSNCGYNEMIRVYCQPYRHHENIYIAGTLGGTVAAVCLMFAGLGCFLSRRDQRRASHNNQEGSVQRPIQEDALEMQEDDFRIGLSGKVGYEDVLERGQEGIANHCSIENAYAETTLDTEQLGSIIEQRPDEE